MRNQKPLAKVVPRIATTSASIAMVTKTLTRRSYPNLETLLQMECHHILNRLQRVQHKYFYTLLLTTLP